MILKFGDAPNVDTFQPHICPIHIVTFTLISNLATDYVLMFKREQARLSSSLLNTICHKIWYQSKSDYMAWIGHKMQHRLNPRKLRSMDSYIKILCRFQKSKQKNLPPSLGNTVSEQASIKELGQIPYWDPKLEIYLCFLCCWRCQSKRSFNTECPSALVHWIAS